jgi:general secretion pathway protein G
MKQYSGLSLVEIAIVILIAALIVGTVTPVYLRIIENKRTDLAITEITGFQRDIDRFGRRNMRYPQNLAEVYPAAPIDPWGNPYQYTNIKNAISPGSVNPRTDNNLKRLNADYDLYSNGPDKTSLSPVAANESRDDIIRAKNGNYVGIASEYR